MIVDLPKTSVSTVGRRLIQLRNDSGAMALSRVLTLVIVVNDKDAEEAIASANDASRMHPCRIIVVVPVNGRGASRLDAQIRVGGDAGASEVVVLRVYGELTHHGVALVLPLLLADSPIVGWWPGEAPADLGADPIGALCQRRINDSAAAANPFRELQRRAKNYRPGDTDLAWSRITRWRAVLASALDQPPYDKVTGGVVVGGVDSSATDLMAAWLTQALKVPFTRARTPAGTGLISVRLERASGTLDLVRPDGLLATLTHPLMPVRRVPLARRSDAECLADELSRLDNDDVYESTLTKGLAKVSSRRSATASTLVREGKAPSVEEARALSRKVARESRLTGADMVTVEDVDVVPSASAPAEDSIATRAVAQKAVARKVTGDGGSDQARRAVDTAQAAGEAAGAGAEQHTATGAVASTSAPATRSTAKKTTARKATTKQATATKAPATKATAKKAAATTSKATTAKKTTAKKTTAKKG
ncbi:glucose-6-phosphate dehydrogenase assembly protein OpcA [Arsenicicoccus piscis]|uniref:Glucose-6-phosphate dehydrogenase assembly protein OpcA n=1 Tax=Arsenicicoccus piscis TaxID=673954 RepID=A0ABQ6HN30_9MICO|nr:glucose-6-phosphate dehydrogenase assembly protein OpcA [Arsenicicoccus piscis]MCH8628926.1 glucose-6-phosphate dehydrogenase assembly protein OpcA [Arsenicicoccus piscis]GMA19535.1 hypothetical protein GCM10025862_15560 [Arsenicicoccus piscis]